MSDLRHGWRVLAVALALASSPAAAGIPTWPELPGCPLDEHLDLPAGFEYEPSGRSREATGMVVLPASFDEVASLVQDVDGYPSWVLVDRFGAPLLRDMAFDAATGRGAITVGDGDDDRIEGILKRTREDGFVGLDLEMLAGDRIKEARLEIGVAPYERCEGTTLVFIRATWKVGLLTHMLAPEAALSIPAFLVLALRDDVAAKVMSGMDEVVEQIRQGLPAAEAFAAPDGGVVPEDAELSLLYFEPASIGLHETREAELIRELEPATRGKSVKPSKSVPAFFRAVSGAHTIRAWQAAVRLEGAEGPATTRIGVEPGQLVYLVELTGGQFMFWFGMPQR